MSVNFAKDNLSSQLYLLIRMSSPAIFMVYEFVKERDVCPLPGHVYYKNSHVHL